MIHANDLSFEYTAGVLQNLTHRGVENLSFTCAPGTITLLAGPSGSGKSTVIKLLNGLAPHFHEGKLQGSLEINGFTPSEHPLHTSSKHCATVFQNPRTQFFTDTVITELAFGLENLGIPGEEIQQHIDTVSEETNISSLLHRKLHGLSGGQLQQVAYATALMPNTDVMLFDEPTSNLSDDGIEMLRGTIAKLKKTGHTIVLAEHRLHPFRNMVDQVLYIRDGRIAQTFTGNEFFQLDTKTRHSLGLRELKTPKLGSIPRLPTHAEPSGSEGLEISNLQYTVNKTRVLNIEHLYFPAGKICALMGPNGVGKTTFGRILCGLAQPDRNTGAQITLDGTVLSAKQRVAESYIVMQDVGRQLFAETVASEVTLGIRHPVDTESLLADMDLASLADRHPHSLSGGQRQRLVIATAMAHRKRVYVFDEPTSGVGIEHLEAISKQFRSLADAGAVIIVITHDAELVQACADYLHILQLKEDMHS